MTISSRPSTQFTNPVRASGCRVYSKERGRESIDEIAIVVQQLVKAESSGVLFTANPVTGQRNEAMLTATWGLGEALVGGMVTPDTLVIQKQTGRILSREIANKQVMTVLLETGTREQPISENIRCLPVLSDAQVAALVDLGNQIETFYGMPMDIEWVSTGKEILLVQARPITTLSKAEASVPVTWKLPKGVYAALRNNIVELMPNPLTPLFATLGREAINTSLGGLLTYFLGKPGVMPDEIIITVNGYAYYNGSVSLQKGMGMVLDIIGILKRMFNGAVERWTETGRPEYITAIEKLRASPCEHDSTAKLLDSASKLYEAAIDAYGALVSGVIPASWMSEALFTKFYDTFVRRHGDPSAQTFLLGFDSAPILAEKSLFDLGEWVRQHTGLSAFLMMYARPTA